ncbi:hypothetical protein GYMLUDRAFT_179717 [Collybiopsis luxurians FD-317 M1]|uniref:CxC2-like cysteine cluster KDZ transposase-associated domain-containing protein n=1 Tax=Collybiopsis luxurians FD-317 M1 TaxID=944289 RepID=A0A0D0BTJ3_9AGAR|nr:hypothetical protein GYMLUDRAFT_179717 [Collybiopsis luxurians FD-317 M1]
MLSLTFPILNTQVWTSSFFTRCSLQSLGLVLHLGGHSPDQPCLVPSQAETLVALDVTGIHPLAVKVCHCHQTLLL